MPFSYSGSSCGSFAMASLAQPASFCYIPYSQSTLSGDDANHYNEDDHQWQEVRRKRTPSMSKSAVKSPGNVSVLCSVGLSFQLVCIFCMHVSSELFRNSIQYHRHMSWLFIDSYHSSFTCGVPFDGEFGNVLR